MLRYWGAPSMVLISGAIASSITAATIHVPADRPTVQSAIESAGPGDVVLVAPGTYREHLDFLGKPITVASTDGPAVTILDDTYGPNATFDEGEDRRAVLSGFTIQSYETGLALIGSSPTIKGNVIINKGGFYSGGNLPSPVGIHVCDGSPLVKGNLLIGWNPALALQGSSSDVIGNVIAENEYGIGGTNDESLIRDNVIVHEEDNALYLTDAPVSIVQNLIVDDGEGIAWYGVPPKTIALNTIASMDWGPAIEGSFAAPLTVESNLMLAGTTQAVVCDAYDAANPPIFRSNDAYSMQGVAWGSRCVDQTGLEGNISTDPLLVGTAAGDFHLGASSPAIDAGSVVSVDVPATDIDGDRRVSNGVIDIGADEYNATPVLELSPRMLVFDTNTSAIQTVTLRNSGASPTAIGLVTTSRYFTETSTCGSVLGPSESCTIDVTSDGGFELAGVLSVMTDATEAPLVAFLAAHARAPYIYPDPPYFDGVRVGAHAQQVRELYNAGNQDLLITSIEPAAGAEFMASSNCPMSPVPLAPGSRCEVTYVFTPVAVGARQGTVTITSNDPRSPLAIPIHGEGLSSGIASLSTSAVTFAPQVIGATSAPVPITLTNTGAGPLGLFSIWFYSSYYDPRPPFSQSNDCPSILGVGAACTIQVSFTPHGFGASDQMYVFNDGISAASVSLTGSGTIGVPTLTSVAPLTVPVASPSTLDLFGNGFATTTVAQWNGSDLPTTFVDETHVQAVISAALTASLQSASITVRNPSPGGLSGTAMVSTYSPTGYVASPATYEYRPIAETPVSYGDIPVRVESPFPVHFGGSAFSALYVSSDGWISFQPSVAPLPETLLPAVGPSTLVAPFWLDPPGWFTSSGWEFSSQVLGDFPSRELVVEWRQREIGIVKARYEVVFLEDRSDVLFIYADVHLGWSYAYENEGASATIGIQVGSRQATQFSHRTPSVDDQTTILWTPAPTGDANGDGAVDLRDIFALIAALYAGGPLPVGSCDVNGDGRVDVADVFYLINYLYAGGPAPL